MWKDQLLGDKPDGEVIPVNKWLARMTLDVIGESMYASLSRVFCA
jgi:alkylphenol/PAH-inducible cytochrome P450 monooxygenase